MNLGDVTTASRTTSWASITGGVYTMSIDGTLHSDVGLRTTVALEYRENNGQDEKLAGDTKLTSVSEVVNVQLAAGEVRARLIGGDADTDLNVRLAEGA